MKKKTILLVYPALGLAGQYVVNIPISLLYAAVEAVRLPRVEVELLDCRITHDWRQRLRDRLRAGHLLLVGISVMSGMPVAEAEEITRLVRQQGDLPVVWGGAHPTILPHETLSVPGVTHCIRGFGSKALAQLAQALLSDQPQDLHQVKGLCYWHNGEMHLGEIQSEFEVLPHDRIPFALVEPLLEQYFATQNQRVFPIYTSSGCPYRCAFCISPVWYQENRRKWVPHPVNMVVDHIAFLVERYRVEMIYFYDDDTFVRVDHFMGVARELLRRGIRVQLGVRGIRVNEILKVKEEEFALLEQVGVRYLHIGLESGSQRMLDLMRKGIRVEQSLEANRYLARFPGIIPMYNLMCGLPTETREDLKATGRMMMQLARENPRCILFDPGKFIPYPGSELYTLAQEHGFTPPTRATQWRQLDQETDIRMPWYDDRFNRYVHMLQMVSYVLSHWEHFLTGYPWHLRAIYHVARGLYRPLAWLRLRYHLDGWLWEWPVYTFVRWLLNR